MSAPLETTMVLPTVLLVDDDDAVRRVTARYLTRLGYEVIPASDAVHALTLTTAQTRINLVLTDMALPGMSGPALLSELRAQRPFLPMILMTGFAPEAAQSEEWPRGTILLRKPFTLDELRHCLARQAESSPLSAVAGGRSS